MTTPSPLPTVADCAGVPDADGDGLRNQCDDVDADIFLRRARIRGSKPTTGEILAKGEVELGPEAPFDPLLGLDIQLVDTLHLDRRFTFAATECSALRSGRIVCKAPGGRATARFQPLRAKPGRIRFDLRFQGLTLTEPFAPALLVRITTDPASAPAGVDRVGSLSSCRVTAKALLCVAPR